MALRVADSRAHAIVMALTVLLTLANVPQAQATCTGTPPVFLNQAAYAEAALVVNGTVIRSTPVLAFYATVDDPGGTVPATIASVQVTDPNSNVTALPYSYPDRWKFGLAAVGQYYKNTGSTSIPTGTYQFQATNANGCTTTVSTTLATFPVLAQVSIASPAVEQILDTTTPVIKWSSIGNGMTYSVRIVEAGTFATSGQVIFTSPKIPTTIDERYTVPAGILSPGRRYAVRVEAYDTWSEGFTTGGQWFNTRSVAIRDFSVAGPTAALSSDKSQYTSIDTVTLSLRLRNQLTAPVNGHLRLWITPPSGWGPSLPPVTLVDADMQFPASLDTGTIQFVSAPASGLTTEHWSLGVQINATNGDVIAERIIGFDIGIISCFTECSPGPRGTDDPPA